MGKGRVDRQGSRYIVPIAPFGPVWPGTASTCPPKQDTCETYHLGCSDKVQEGPPRRHGAI